MKLTEPQERALRILAETKQEYLTPASLGEAMHNLLPPERKRHQWGLKAQGAGRLGGAMGTRLVKKGLAVKVDKKSRDGEWMGSGYAISNWGREVLGHERG